jgi:hypothetical protein
MSAEETIVAIAGGTDAAVVAKIVNSNKLVDKLTKTRKTRWFRWVDINIPNDFEEADAHVADPNIIASAATLQTLGKLITVGKYSIIVVMALSLTVLYGMKYTVLVGDYKPTSFADYNRFRALQPGLRCSCGVQISPFSNFASASVDTNPTCAWVTQDLIGYARENACPSVSGGSGSDALGKCDDLSTCRSAGTLPLCQATDESCKQSNQTIEWILQEFRNTPVSSTELLAQDTLEKLVNQTFESAIKLGSLISTTPVKTVEAWASLNMPEIVGNIDAVTNEVQNIAKIGLRTGNHLQTCTDCSSDETTQMTSFATNQRKRYEKYSRANPPPEVGFQSSNFKTGCGYTNAWLETKMEPDTADTHVAVNYYLKPGTIEATVGGVTYQNYFDALAEGNLPVPDKDTYFFNQSKTTGCDPYSAALDTTYFAYDTPEKLVEAWNVTAGEIDRYFRANIAAAGEEVDTSSPGGNYDAQFADRYGPGSRSDYEPKFAIPIMKRHGTLRNAISNLFIDEKVVSVNYEDYFDTCAITSCTYTYRAQLSTAALTSVIFGLIGGIVAFMKLLGGFVYDACKAAVLRGAEGL